VEMATGCNCVLNNFGPNSMTKPKVTYAFQFKKNVGLNAQQVRHAILTDIEEEIDRARAKYPSNEFMLDALHEEGGELAQAMIDYSRSESGSKAKTVKDIYMEAIQTAAVAIRILEEGDAAHAFKGLFETYTNTN
jgi:hypothetical protein